ncbi:MAG: hypothetical protein HY900_27600 [Deltaproteobacteria bacterium]|nr:hypothetical protein [Deltaproteobacteria bacterium]
MPIHLGRRPSREGWISFETDPYLTKTKERLYRRCLPCLSGLLEQLKAGTPRIELREAWTCWKVTVVASGPEECQRILEAFGEAFPAEPVLGKLGGGVGRSTCAVVFHTESEERRDELVSLLRTVLASRFPGKAVFSSRACGNPYETLLGPWPAWQRLATIKHPEKLGSVKENLIASLYRQGS